MDNGSNTSCHKLTFRVNEIRDANRNGDLIDDQAGPFCPTSLTSTDGGVGIYDGATNPGFQNLTQTLWNAMRNDGYTIIDRSNLVCIQDPGAGRNGVIQGDNSCQHFCLNAAADDQLTVTYLIPESPQQLSTPDNIGMIEHVGVSLDGVPITGNPPSVVNGPMGRGGGNIPALDHCGGHHDPAGYYHWHFIADSIDLVHQSLVTDSQADCSVTLAQSSTVLAGYARDGYPIYAHQDLISGQSQTPTDLDQCNGPFGNTAEFPDGIYHYHASLSAPNLPRCITGAAARLSPTVQ